MEYNPNSNSVVGNAMLIYKQRRKHIKVYCLLIIVLFANSIYSQTYDSLDANNLKASFDGSDVFFQRNGQAYGYYETPKGLGITPIFVSSFWLSGLDTGNNVKSTAAMYYPDENFSSGPISTGYDSRFDIKYKHPFKISHLEILNHIAHYLDAGYIVPTHIAQWPGNGNTTNGEAAMLAPFIDLNHNQIYEPALGDYPDICGDQAIFIMYNDDRATQRTIGCTKLKVEYHVLAYALSSNTDTALNNTMFFHVKVFNRSAISYHQVLFSNFVDPDLGCSENDRIGCDTLLNSFFVYNDPDIPDLGTACLSNTKGYGRNKIAQGFTFLNHSLSAFKLAGQEGALMQTEPMNCSQIRMWQSGHWFNGSPVTVGGNGYGGSVPIAWQYPGDPLDSTQWSELHTQNSTIIQAGDRREIGTASIDSLASGNFITVDLAYITSFADSTSSKLAELVKLKQDIRHIRHLYDINTACTSTLTNILDPALPLPLHLYPNPSTGSFTLQSEGLLHQSYTIYDLLGHTIASDIITTNNQTITLPDVQDGLYILNVTGNPRPIRFTIVK